MAMHLSLPFEMGARHASDSASLSWSESLG